MPDPNTDAWKPVAETAPPTGWTAVQESAPAQDQHEGFWKALGSDLYSMVKSAPKMALNLMTMGLSGDIEKAKAEYDAYKKTGQTLEQQQNEQRKAAGYDPAYRYGAAPLAQAVGVNVPGMEQSAAQGDTAGVLGHAAAVPAVMAGTEGAIRGGGALVRNIAPGAAERLQASALDQYNKALAPTKERTKFLAQKRTPEMLERGITATSPADLADTARAKASAATKQLNDIYESLPAERKSPTAPMVQALDEYKAQFQDRLPITDEQLRSELSANKGQVPANIVQDADGSLHKVITLNQDAVNAAESLKSTIQQYGESISPQSMRKARQIFDESVARAGGFEGRPLAEGSLLDARAEAGSAIRRQLAKDNPELVPLNAEVNFWLDVQRIAQETAKRRVGQQGGLTVQLAKRTGQVIGGGVGYQVGGAWGAAAGAYMGGETAANLARVTQSTKWRTVSAVAKNQLADALAAGNMRLADSQIRFLGAKLGVTFTASQPRYKSQASEAGSPEP